MSFLLSNEPIRHIQVRGARMRSADAGRSRLALTILLVAGLFSVLAARLIDLTLEGVAPKAAHKSEPVVHARAQLLDRNGAIIATDLATASVYADARVITDPYATASAIASVLPELDEEALVHKLASKRAFIWVARGLSPKQHSAVHNLGLAGIGFRNEPRRIYPNGVKAAHVIGYTDVDNRGLAGMEHTLDKELRGQKEPIRLSLDLRVQHIAEDELGQAMARFSAKAAAGVILDMENGEVLASASLPNFDPNTPGLGNAEACLNRVSLGVFELGSIFKVITTAYALDSGLVQLSDSFDTSVPIQEAGFTINDFHGVKRSLTVPEIFMRSSNIGTVRMMLQAGEGMHRQLFAKLGLLDRVGGELPERGMPLVAQRWERITSMTTSYGHGIAVTPLHYAVAAASLLNGGRRIEPTFLLAAHAMQPQGQQVISETTSEYLRALMRLTVTHGTGHGADVAGYHVGGKTGTAEKPGESGGYREHALISSFVAIFPADKPRYLVFALLDEPQGIVETHGYATGGWTAAPTVGRMIERIAPLLGMAPVRGSDPLAQTPVFQFVSFTEAD
jgi:cell division protein FtsI (penicillin-binding protein 3)